MICYYGHKVSGRKGKVVVVTELAARHLVNLFAGLILSYMIRHNDLLDTKRRRAALYAVAAVGVSIIAETITVTFVSPDRIHRFLNLVFSVVGFGLSPFVPFLLVNTFSGTGSKRALVFALPAIVNLVLAFLSPFYGFIFRISPANEYARGPWFFVYVASYLFGMAVFLLRTLRAIHIYQNRNKIVLVGLVGLTLFGTTIQLIHPDIPLSWSTITLVLILGYAYYGELLDKHDVMTHLFNRRAYEQYLPQLISRGSGSIILFDVDDFKGVNDRHGHQYGDRCLETIARNIRTCFGRIGPSYRIGGDEFCVLSTCDNERVIQEAEGAFLREMEFARGQDPRIPLVSFGHAIYDPSCELEEMVAEADQRLFLNKRQRKAEDHIVNE